jgi:hypothetical protein
LLRPAMLVPGRGLSLAWEGPDPGRKEDAPDRSKGKERSRAGQR